MNFLEIAQRRYATKMYDATKKVSPEDLDALKEILRLTPSSINIQPWKFTIVSDPHMKEQFAVNSMEENESRIKDAGHLLIISVIDDLDKLEKEMPSYMPEPFVNAYHYMKSMASENGVRVWLRQQVYISLGYFLAACASMGIDTTPMEGFNNVAFDNLLQDPDYTSLVIVPFGYAMENDPYHPSNFNKQRRAKEDIIREI